MEVVVSLIGIYASNKKIKRSQHNIDISEEKK